MKIIGWILTLLGSNGLTGTLVAMNGSRYSLLNDHPWLNGLADRLSGVAGFFGLDDISEGIKKIQNDAQGYIQLVDTLFYISIGVLAVGGFVLAVAYTKSAIKHRRVAYEPGCFEPNNTLSAV